jgi:hypothetical protein
MREAVMKAKLLCDAGEITNGEDVEVVTKAKAPKRREPGDANVPEYTVRDDAGHEESVASSDLVVLR